MRKRESGSRPALGEIPGVTAISGARGAPQGARPGPGPLGPILPPRLRRDRRLWGGAYGFRWGPSAGHRGVPLGGHGGEPRGSRRPERTVHRARPGPGKGPSGLGLWGSQPEPGGGPMGTRRTRLALWGDAAGARPSCNLPGWVLRVPGWLRGLLRSQRLRASDPGARSWLVALAGTR